MLYLSGEENYFATAEDIARDMQIPKSFLHKILKKLEKARLIQLKRGLSGGIRLLKEPFEITLFDVIVAMEKTVALNRCVVSDKICGLSSTCPVHPVWFKVREKLIQALKEVNFKELTGAA